MRYTYIKSPLNYTGGKYKLLPQLLPLFPQNIKTFYDIFGGGFNVGINVASNKVVYSDLSLPVVQMLEYFRNNDTQKVLDEIDNLTEQYQLSKTNVNGYKMLRNNYNHSENKEPVMLYVLICHSFNNQIRFNSKGEFNLPFGNRTLNQNLRQNLIYFLSLLHCKDVGIINSDFRDFASINFDKDDFLYCDPPYYNSTASYNESGKWGVDEADLLQMLSQLKVRWALSNNLKTNPDLEAWADSSGFVVHHLNCDYSNCNYHKKDKSGDDEVLITNYTI